MKIQFCEATREITLLYCDVACVIIVFFLIIDMIWVISICENDFPCLNVKFVLFSCECGAFSWEEGDLYEEMHLI